MLVLAKIVAATAAAAAAAAENCSLVAILLLGCCLDNIVGALSGVVEITLSDVPANCTGFVEK
jgi:uncharacterized membrane protein